MKGSLEALGRDRVERAEDRVGVVPGLVPSAGSPVEPATVVGVPRMGLVVSDGVSLRREPGDAEADATLNFHRLRDRSALVHSLTSNSIIVDCSR